MAGALSLGFQTTVLPQRIAWSILRPGAARGELPVARMPQTPAGRRMAMLPGPSFMLWMPRDSVTENAQALMDSWTSARASRGVMPISRVMMRASFSLWVARIPAVRCTKPSRAAALVPDQSLKASAAARRSCARRPP